jgi:hypothetical protein
MDEIDSADPRFYDILNGHLAKLREVSIGTPSEDQDAKPKDTSRITRP